MILLTSTGFDNENIKEKFMKYINTEKPKILFIISAANDPDSIRILSGCLDDITKCGIKDEFIKIYDLHEKEKLENYDAIYVCGGSTKRLLERMNEINFKEDLLNYLEKGGIYIGVSAGSVALSKKYENGLGIIDNYLDVHCDKGTPNGIVNNEDIYLTDNQALIIDKEKIVFE